MQIDRQLLATQLEKLNDPCQLKCMTAGDQKKCINTSDVSFIKFKFWSLNTWNSNDLVTDLHSPNDITKISENFQVTQMQSELFFLNWTAAVSTFSSTCMQHNWWMFHSEHQISPWTTGMLDSQPRGDNASKLILKNTLSNGAKKNRQPSSKN